MSKIKNITEEPYQSQYIAHATLSNKPQWFQLTIHFAFDKLWHNPIFSNIVFWFFPRRKSRTGTLKATVVLKATDTLKATDDLKATDVLKATDNLKATDVLKATGALKVTGIYPAFLRLFP